MDEIIQIPFYLPPEIKAGIEAGKLFQRGEIIWNSAGRIYAHLKEVEIPEEVEEAKSKALAEVEMPGEVEKVTSTSKVLESVLEFAKEHKNSLIGVGIGVGIGLTIGIIYDIIKNKKNKEVKIPTSVIDVDKAFAEYLEAIQTETVSEEKIDNVISALMELRQQQEGGNIHITLPAEYIDRLLNVVRDYTIEFVKANKGEIDESDFDGEDRIVGLEYYLNIQKQVFQKCA